MLEVRHLNFEIRTNDCMNLYDKLKILVGSDFIEQ